jgi:hypothetical protein
VADSIAEEVQDDFIAQDVQLARVDSALQKRIDARLDELGRELRALTLEVDVAGTQRRDARIRRLRRLNVESRELIAQAFADINLMTKKVLANVAAIESMLVVDSLENNIP